MKGSDNQFNRAELAKDILRVENLLSMLEINLTMHQKDFDKINPILYGTRLIKALKHVSVSLDELVLEILNLPKSEVETPEAA